MCDRPTLSNAAECAAYVGLPIGTWRDLARRRDWPCYRIGHSVRWDLDEIVPLLRSEDGER